MEDCEDKSEKQLNNDLVECSTGDICDVEIRTPPEKKLPKESVKEMKPFPILSVWKLYLSRFLTAWGDRLWTFAGGMFMYKIHPENLSLLAIYGLVNSLSVLLLGAAIGNWIDGTHRLRAAKTFLLIQNLCVAFNCMFLAAFFHFKEHFEDFPWFPYMVAGLVTFFAVVANLASTGSKIVVEKDWIVVIAGGSETKLAMMNSVFRTIDLSCQTVTPVLAGMLFTFTNYQITAVFVLAWNLISVIFEYVLLHLIYKQFPGLSVKSTSASHPLEATETSLSKNWIQIKLTGSYRGWAKYMGHKIRNAGLGLACLYMTVLGFDNITWGYSLMQCVSESTLGILVAISALIGIMGSLSFPPLRKSLGVERAGMVGMTSLVLSLSLCVVSIWLPGSPFDLSSITRNVNQTTDGDFNQTTSHSCTQGDEGSGGTPRFESVGVLLAGIIAARFGLWLADLSITQILQENVDEEERGVIGGVQSSSQCSMDLLKYVFVLLIPSQETFGILIILSFLSICLGAISLASYSWKESKLCCNSTKKIKSNVDLNNPESDAFL